MDVWITEDVADTVGRPIPWHEMVPVASLDALAWSFSAREQHPTGDLPVAIRRAVLGRRNYDDATGCYYGGTEPLDRAVKRLGVPTDGMVYLLRDGETLAMLIAMSELIVFREVLWRDYSFIVDIDGRWALAGLHDDAARFIDRRSPG